MLLGVTQRLFGFEVHQCFRKLTTYHLYFYSPTHGLTYPLKCVPSVAHTLIHQHLLCVTILLTLTEQMYKGQEHSGSFCTHTFSVAVASRCDFHSFGCLAESETADEGRAACSSTTLVITSQGTEQIDHHTATV